MSSAKQGRRESLSKKVRFEVFKRDKFTCVYCGRKAPDVILEVDHVFPVSKGGDNNITNLITSCVDCNSGKRDIPLQVNETLEKQRLQMELLQEKREQLEMLFEWKKSLDELDEYESDLFIQYLEGKIQPYTLTKPFRNEILKLFKKYKHEEIFEAITISANKYLRYNSEGAIIQDSANEFLQKNGGILVNKKLPPIKQKLSYIKGICRKRFSYWDDRKGSIILNKYIQALTKYGWSDDEILQDLEEDVMKIAKAAKNWSEWRNILESWTVQINSLDNKENNSKLTNDDLKMIIENSYSELLFYIDFMKYVAHVYCEDNEDNVFKAVIDAVIKYNDLQYEKLLKNEDIQDVKPCHQVFEKIGLLYFIKDIDTTLKYVFSNVIDIYSEKFFNEELYLPNKHFSNVDDIIAFQNGLKDKLHQNFNGND